MNGVEKYLLELARMEVEVVADRIVEELNKNKKIPKDIDLSLIPPKDLLGQFFRPDIVRCLGEHINANISGDEVNKQDLLSFMQIVYTISMYKISPGACRYFDKKNKAIYVPVNQMKQ